MYDSTGAFKSNANMFQKALYGNTSITQLDLVKRIQDILKELSEIGRSFPQALILDFTRPLGTVTRTGSSLYLMLFQVRSVE